MTSAQKRQQLQKEEYFREHIKGEAEQFNMTGRKLNTFIDLLMYAYRRGRDSTHKG